MKRLFLSSIIALVLAACSPSGTAAQAPSVLTNQTQSTQTTLQGSVDRLAAAWNAGDGNRWAAEFWPDGSLVNILGVVFPNAAAVGAITTQILAGPFNGSTFAPVVRRTRFIGSGAAIFDTDVSVTKFRGLPPGVVPTAPGLLLTRLTLVFENRGGVWKIQSAQNTAVTPGSYTPAAT